MTFPEVLACAQFEYETRSRCKYDWTDLPPSDQWAALEREVKEAHSAHVAGEVDGPHGERSELLHVIVVAARRIMEISK